MSVATLFVAALLLFSACKKKDDSVTPTSSSSQKADDASAKTELDNAQQDIETVYNSSQYAGNQRTTAVDLPCGTVTLNTNNFTIIYGNGVSCGSRVISGSIDVTLFSGVKFSDSAAVLRVIFTNYKVHYNASGQNIIFNDTLYITNATGGKLSSLVSASGTIIHRTRGNVQLTYDTTGKGGNLVTRTWHLFRKKTFTSTGSLASITGSFDGDTTINSGTWLSSSAGGFEKVSEYGMDVNNLKFVHTIPTTFTWAYCGTDANGNYIYTLKQGEIVHTAFTNNSTGDNYKYQFTGIAGYNISGTPSLVNDCSANGYQIGWTLTDITNTSLPPYTYTTYQPY